MPTPSLFPLYMKAQSGEGSGLLGLIDAEITPDLSVEISSVILSVEISDPLDAEVGSSPIQASVSAPIMVELNSTPIVTEVC